MSIPPAHPLWGHLMQVAAHAVVPLHSFVCNAAAAQLKKSIDDGNMYELLADCEDRSARARTRFVGADDTIVLRCRGGRLGTFAMYGIAGPPLVVISAHEANLRHVLADNFGHRLASLHTSLATRRKLLERNSEILVCGILRRRY